MGTSKLLEIGKIEQMLQNSGVIITGDHFVYVSGKHGSTYVNKDRISLVPGLISAIAEDICANIGELKPDIIVAPPMGAIMLAGAISNILGEPAAYADIKNDVVDGKVKKVGLVLKRGFDDALTGKRVLVVEDVLTTGGSVRQLLNALVAAQIEDCEVVGVAAIYNRGGVTAKNLGVPFLYSSVNTVQQMFDRDNCPFCADNIPINTDYGHGAAYVAAQQEN